ncbi:MAG TPA: hypothetical protein VLT36_16510 [Candidatus Dormibacteraeota bacterium]|nr:hypothetical protein [Candidatus Dormibacteraeota bacterium]
MSAFLLTGLLCPLLLVALFVMAIVATIRFLSRSASGSSGLSTTVPRVKVPTQIEQDGFWLLSCPADPGSIIYYHYWSGGARYSGQVPFNPGADGRQFVYTGRGPEQVSVARIVQVDDDDLTSSLIPPAIAAASMWDPPDTFSAPSPPPPYPSSFPSAY